MRAIFEISPCLYNIIMTHERARRACTCRIKHTADARSRTMSELPGADVGSDFYRALR